jgi:hypothetical protein
MRHLPPGAHPIRTPAGRGDGARRGGRRDAGITRRARRHAGCASAGRRSGRSPTLVDASALSARRASPSATPAVVATDRGARVEDAGGALPRESRPSSADFGHPVVIPRRTCATGVQAACRLSRRSDRSPTFLDAGALRPPSIPIRPRRPRRRTMARRGADSGGGMRVMASRSCGLRASGSDHPRAPSPRACGCASASR